MLSDRFNRARVLEKMRLTNLNNVFNNRLDGFVGFINFRRLVLEIVEIKGNITVHYCLFTL